MEIIKNNNYVVSLSKLEIEILSKSMWDADLVSCCGHGQNYQVALDLREKLDKVIEES